MHPSELLRIKTFTRRSALLGGAKLSLMGVLAGRLYYLQVVKAERYRVLADENRVNLRLLPPQRGRIFDRAGRVIAENKQNYRVVLVPELAGDVAETLTAIDEIIPISDDERERILREVRQKRGFLPVTVREHLSWTQVSRIEVSTPGV